MPLPSSEITELLHTWSRGDTRALERLVPLVLEDLRRMARRHLQGERAGHTLQPTALVNELYLKLADQRDADWQNRDQFFAVASRIMYRILTDYAKARQTAKRGGDVLKIPLDEAFAPVERRDGDLLALAEALERLGEIDPRQARIVELRYLFGFEHAEIAILLKISETTSKREWRMAKLWLRRELTRA